MMATSSYYPSKNFQTSTINLDGLGDEEKKNFFVNQLKFIYGKFVDREKTSSFKDIVHLRENLHFKIKGIISENQEKYINDIFSDFKEAVEREFHLATSRFCDFNKYESLEYAKRNFSKEEFTTLLKEALANFTEKDFCEKFEKLITDFMEGNYQFPMTSTIQDDEQLTVTRFFNQRVEGMLKNCYHCQQIYQYLFNFFLDDKTKKASKRKKIKKTPETIESGDSDDSDIQIRSAAKKKNMSMLESILNITDTFDKYSSIAILKRNAYNRDMKLKNLFRKEKKFFGTELEAENYIKIQQPKININASILFIGDSSLRDLKIQEIKFEKNYIRIQKKFMLIGITQLMYEDLEAVLNKWKISAKVLILHPKIRSITSPIPSSLLQKFAKVLFCYPYGSTFEEDRVFKKVIEKMKNRQIDILDLRNMLDLGFERDPTGKSHGKHLTKEAQRFTFQILLKKLKDMNLDELVNYLMFF